MVTRKPVPSPANPASGLEAPYSPPYPTTPSTSAPPARLQMQDARGQVAIDSDVDSDNAWEEEAVNKHNTGNDTSLPSSLRVGPVGYTPRASQERLATPSSTNPFIQRQHTGSSNSGKESSAGAWGAAERPLHLHHHLKVYHRIVLVRITLTSCQTILFINNSQVSPSLSQIQIHGNHIWIRHFP